MLRKLFIQGTTWAMSPDDLMFYRLFSSEPYAQLLREPKISWDSVMESSRKPLFLPPAVITAQFLVHHAVQLDHKPFEKGDISLWCSWFSSWLTTKMWPYYYWLAVTLLFSNQLKAKVCIPSIVLPRFIYICLYIDIFICIYIYI